LKLVQTHLNADWVEKCEKNLYLSKNLGNIYAGSLYNGLLSLLNRSNGNGIDLRGKKIMLFSYGSGCAASLFLIRVSNDLSYKKVI